VSAAEQTVRAYVVRGVVRSGRGRGVETVIEVQAASEAEAIALARRCEPTVRTWTAREEAS